MASDPRHRMITVQIDAEDLRAVVEDVVAPLADEVRSLRAELAARSAEWVSRDELARRRGCSVDSIDQEVKMGRIQSRRVGKRGVRVLDAPMATESEIARLARAISRPQRPEGMS